MVRPEDLEEGEPIHPRHFQIQGDDVGIGRESSPGDVHPPPRPRLRSRILFKRVPDGPSGQGGIIDDQHADPSGRTRLSIDALTTGSSPCRSPCRLPRMANDPKPRSRCRVTEYTRSPRDEGTEWSIQFPAEDHVLRHRDRVFGLEQIDPAKLHAVPQLRTHPAASGPRRHTLWKYRSEVPEPPEPHRPSGRWPPPPAPASCGKCPGCLHLPVHCGEMFAGTMARV